MIQRFRRETLEDPGVDALVAAANPFPDHRVRSLQSNADLGELRDGMRAVPRQRTSMWRSPGIGKAFLVVLAVAVLVAGIGAVWGAHTGIFGRPGYTESDTSEYLRADSPEILTVIDRYAVKYALPPGGSWNGFKSTFPRPSGYFGLQTTGLEGMVALDSYCQWRAYWITGYDAQNASEMRTAQKVIDAYPTWAITLKTSDIGAMTEWHRVAAAARAFDGAEMKRLQPLQCGGPANLP